MIPTSITKETYYYYIMKELASSFVAATATVYFACLFSGLLLTLIGSMSTCCSEVIPDSNFLKSIFDTVQSIRWNSFPWRVNSELRVRLILHAILFGHIPLCGKMIQNIGQTVRRKCRCDNSPWKRVLGGIAGILFYATYSCAIVYRLQIQVNQTYKYA